MNSLAVCMEHITMDSFEEKVLKADKPVIVDFYADWCGPCKMLAPIFEELSKETDGMEFFKVNVEDANDLAAKYNVRSIPTLLIFKDGEIVEQMMGALPKPQLESAIQAHI